MIIKTPTYENLVPYLGRTVTIDQDTGRLAIVLENFSGQFYAGLAKDPNCWGSKVGDNAHYPKVSFVGPVDIPVKWKSHFTTIKIHDPIGNFKQ